MMKRVVTLIILVLSICNTMCAQPKVIQKSYQALQKLDAPAIRLPYVSHPPVPIIPQVSNGVIPTGCMLSRDNKLFIKVHKVTTVVTDPQWSFPINPDFKIIPNHVFQLQVSPITPVDDFIDRGFIPEKHNIAPSGTSDGIGTFEVEQNEQEREKLRDKILRWKHLMNTEMELDPIRISHIKLNCYGEKEKKLTA